MLTGTTQGLPIREILLVPNWRICGKKEITLRLAICGKVKIKYVWFCLLSFMGVKLGLSYWGRNVGWGCFLNRMLRIFGPKRHEVTREWRKLHNEELNDLYSSPSIFRVIKLRIIRWAGHVARMGDKCIQDFDGETWGKETAWKTLAYRDLQ